MNLLCADRPVRLGYAARMAGRAATRLAAKWRVARSSREEHSSWRRERARG